MSSWKGGFGCGKIKQNEESCCLPFCCLGQSGSRGSGGNASAYLDQIEQETIEVDVQEDGSAILTYDLDWRVLDSTSEGALSWVKIGIPNEYAEELTALSDSIDEISYYGRRRSMCGWIWIGNMKRGKW